MDTFFVPVQYVNCTNIHTLPTLNHVSRASSFTVGGSKEQDFIQLGNSSQLTCIHKVEDEAPGFILVGPID